jgi:glycosyltransferase involved in cell wall biosynthesis
LILLNDFKAQWEDISEDAIQSFANVGKSGWYILGKEVAAFEEALSAYWQLEKAAGKTKYPLRKMLGLAVDGIVSFSIVPLRLVTALGFLSAGAAFAGISYALWVRLLTHSWVRGWAITFIGILLMAGVQMLCLGILGEYIGRIYTESKRRPLFIQHAVRRGIRPL